VTTSTGAPPDAGKRALAAAYAAATRAGDLDALAGLTEPGLIVPLGPSGS